MKLKRFEIINYRSCLDTKVPITYDLTALIGVNGVGKTNILNSLMLAKRVMSRRGYLDEDLDEFEIISVIKLIFDQDGEEFHLKLEILYDVGDNNEDEVEAYTGYVKSGSSRHWSRIDIASVDYALRARNGDSGALVRARANYFYRNVNHNYKDKILDAMLLIRNISYYSASQFSDPSKCSISFELDESKPLRYNKRQAHDKFILDLYHLYKNDQPLFKRYIIILPNIRSIV